MAVPGAITAVGAPGWGVTASLARVVGRIVGGWRRESGPQPEQEHVGRSKNPAPPQQRVYGRAALASNGAGSVQENSGPARRSSPCDGGPHVLPKGVRYVQHASAGSAAHAGASR